MKRQVVIAFLFCLSVNAILGQNSFGALHSNYTPTNSLYLNPSSMLDAKVWLDVNIIGAGVYVNNDFAYLKKKRLFNVVKDGIKQTSTLSDDDVGYKHGRKKYHAYNRNFVAGPSAVWSQGDHAIGLSTGARSYSGIRAVPDYVAYFIENGVPEYTDQHDIIYSAKNIKFASIHFGEIKLSYAHTFLKKRDMLFMGGISVSKLFSLAGGAMNVYNFNFLVDNDSLADIFELQSDVMMTPKVVLDAKGGMGLDIGFTYQKMLANSRFYYPNSPKMGCNTIPYKYKIGLSVIDIGNVKFNSSNYFFAGYDFASYNWLHYAQQEVNEDNPTDLFAQQEASIDQGRVKHPNKIRLPTFVSAQLDYNLWRSKVYVNATIIQGIPVGKNQFGLRHANSLSVTPRFESYWFDFALPMSLYEYQHPQLGASLRLGPLTVGTDKLINWISKSNVYGADIYIYLKIPIQYNPKCKDRMGKSRARYRDNSPTRCTY